MLLVNINDYIDFYRIYEEQNQSRRYPLSQTFSSRRTLLTYLFSLPEKIVYTIRERGDHPETQSKSCIAIKPTRTSTWSNKKAKYKPATKRKYK